MKRNPTPWRIVSRPAMYPEFVRVDVTDARGYIVNCFHNQQHQEDLPTILRLVNAINALEPAYRPPPETDFDRAMDNLKMDADMRDDEEDSCD